MGVVVAVLLVPLGRDRHGLLAEGPCGARPPFAFWHRKSSRWCAGGHLLDGMSAYRCALVLAWDGKPVADGLARLCGALDWDWTPKGVDLGQVLWDFVADPLEGPRVAMFGQIVLLDESGRKVAP